MPPNEKQDLPLVRKGRQKAHYNRPLTDRQERFCLLYVLLKNAQEAYTQAGYPARRDHVNGSRGLQVAPYRMLDNVRIKHRIKQLSYRRGLQTKEDLLKFLGFTITSPADGLPKVSDQVRAVEIYGRLEGMFEPEKHEIGVSEGLMTYLQELRSGKLGDRGQIIEIEPKLDNGSDNCMKQLDDQEVEDASVDNQ